MAQPANPVAPTPLAAPTGGARGAAQAVDQAEAQRRLVLPQESFSGTPRLTGGLTYPDEYVTELRDPLKRMDRFEEMRASEEAVNSAITSRVALGLASTWKLISESDKPDAIERLQFVEDNVYPHLEQLLRQLYEAVHYGVGLVEPVFDWADRPPSRQVARGIVQRATKSGTGRRIYLQKLAHIRQRTIYTFLVSERGELLGVRQWVYTGERYALVDIPASKLCIWTYGKRGDDFWGVPPTRYAYKAWTFKQQIERLNLLGIDRFGVGTPVAVAGEGWSQADYDKLGIYLSAWRSGSNTYLVSPPGGQVSILAQNGTLIASVLEWVRYYHIGISLMWLMQGQNLSLNSQSGARALGDTMYDEAATAVQSDNDQLAAIINEQIIVPLVDANFGPQESYPLFNPTQRARDTQVIGQVLQQLVTAGCLHPTPQDEAYIREQLRLPTISLDELQQAETERKAQTAAAQAAQAAGTGPAGDGKSPPPAGKGEQKPSAGDPPPPKRAAATRRAVLARPAVMAPPAPAQRGETYRTPEWAAFEAQVVKPDNLMRDLDLAEARLTGEVQGVLARVDLYLAHMVESIAADGQEHLATTLDRLRVPDSLRAELRTTLLDAARRMRTYGQATVANELRRQQKPDVAGPNRTDGPSFYGPMMSRLRAAWRALLAAATDDGDGSDAEGKADDAQDSADTSAEVAARWLQLQAEVDAVVADEIGRREAAARQAALDALATAPTATPEELAPIAGARAQSALEDLSTGRTRDAVGSVVSTSFGAGRQDAIEQQVARGAPIRALVYSAVMDPGTCSECAKWDGAEFPPDYDQNQPGNVKAPNPNCAGSRKRCRCVWVAILADEALPVVGPSKGPIAAPTVTQAA